MWAATALTASLHSELSVDFTQTILEIAPVMFLLGLHVNFERSLDSTAFRAPSSTNLSLIAWRMIRASQTTPKP
jgi:hypothetical protein